MPNRRQFVSAAGAAVVAATLPVRADACRVFRRRRIARASQPASSAALAFDPFVPRFYSGTRLWSFCGSNVNDSLNDDDYVDRSGSLTRHNVRVHYAGSVTFSETACNMDGKVMAYGSTAGYASAIVTFDRSVPAAENRLGWRCWVDGYLRDVSSTKLTVALWVVNLSTRRYYFHESYSQNGPFDDLADPGWGDSGHVVSPGDNIRFAMYVRADNAVTSWAPFWGRLAVSSCYREGDPCE